jgi:DNA-binding MarR family transcriptional regulator
MTRPHAYAPHAHAPPKRRLRMWVRLLRVTRAAENHLREFLRVEHGTTLPRFDVMAALYRHREGVTMSALSRMLLVSNGNSTAVVDRLEEDGLVRRTTPRSDRRTVRVALTAAGVRAFEALAAGNERRVNALFAALSDREVDELIALLDRTGDGGRS